MSHSMENSTGDCRCEPAPFGAGETGKNFQPKIRKVKTIQGFLCKIRLKKRKSQTIQRENRFDYFENELGVKNPKNKSMSDIAHYNHNVNFRNFRYRFHEFCETTKTSSSPTSSNSENSSESAKAELEKEIDK